MWTDDTILRGFESLTLEFADDYEGPVVATLVRKRHPDARKAVLYIHGFMDYFFQEHVAEAFLARGYTFYALDLRKCGRSFRPHQHPHFCKSLTEYYADISAALRQITGVDGYEHVLLHAHSTGGLTASLYAAEGDERGRVAGLCLNSPFFDFPARKPALYVLATLGRFIPFVVLRGMIPPFYGRSLHREHHGEWEFDTRLKPIEGLPLPLGWLHAIRAGHRRLRQGLSIGCPVLVMHSGKSVSPQRWSDDIHSADSVLNVTHIRRWSAVLGADVTTEEIRDGLHDLALSRADARARFFEALFHWADTLP
jgi:alpha-beta hydrolase superfamily lysophospholipase